jgi:hypothetical protein
MNKRYRTVPSSIVIAGLRALPSVEKTQSATVGAFTGNAGSLAHSLFCVDRSASLEINRRPTRSPERSS